MSLAWTTVVLLLFLLPGFLFIFGVNLSRRAIKQQKHEKNLIASLSGSILVAFIIHSVFVLLLNKWLATGLLPQVDIELLLASFQLEGSEQIGPDNGIEAISANINKNIHWLLLYVYITSLVGHICGRRTYTKYILTYGTHIEKEIARSYKDGGIIFIHALSTLSHDNRLVMYRGYLSDISLSESGEIIYMVLENAERCYLRLDDSSIVADKESRPFKQNDRFYLSGRNIHNIVISRSITTRLELDAEVLEMIHEFIEGRAAEMDIKFSKRNH